MTDDGEKIRVLIADDAADFRALLRTFLSRDERITVVGEASDGTEAISLTRELQPDIVLLDLAMPNTDGLEALEAIRDFAPQLRVVILTGFAEGDLRERAEELGADAFVEKGPSMRQLADTVVELA